ncbi:hypothetical protein FACS1894219_04540 [Clostridia bacterium]|nr:hypothetical protein FACS1894219_04540 [Clostridia bacterium]
MFNRKLLDTCKSDLKRVHYVKKELICGLFKAEQEALIPLTRERFKVFARKKTKTDKYSFIHFASNRYSTSSEYAWREMWLETGTKELRILNEKMRRWLFINADSEKISSL